MFKGLGQLGGLGNIASMMGSIQELPERMQQLNERMKTTTVTESSPCGSVTVTMTATGTVQNVEIVEGVSGEALSTAVLEATNAAGRVAKATYAAAVKELTEELNLQLPGMDGIMSALTGT